MENINYAQGKIISKEKREFSGQFGPITEYTITFLPDEYPDKDAYYIKTITPDHKAVIDNAKQTDTVVIEYKIKGHSFTSKAGNLFKVNNIQLVSISCPDRGYEPIVEESVFPADEGIPF